MDHKLAESLQLADKYTLNELSADERTKFEEHLFDCPICSAEVRQTFTVVESLKEVLREERAASREAVAVPKAGWRDWLRMPSLVPTFAAVALAAVVVYQNAQPSNADMAQVLTPASIVAPVSRGEKDGTRVRRTAPVFLVSFNVDAARADAFVCEFDNAGGQPILTVKSEPQNTASLNLPILLPAKSFPAGAYRMKLHPASEPDSITTYSFVVEDNKPNK